MQIGESFCTPTPVLSEPTQQDIKTTLEQLSTHYLDRSAVAILSMLIGGAPFAMLTTLICKKVSTVDRIKKLIRFIPARIAAFFLTLVCGLLGYDYNNGRRIYQRDRKNHPDPEVGQVLSVYAGALHLRFPVHAPFSIGNIDRTATIADISTVKHIYLFSSWFLILIGCFIRLTFLL